MILEIIILAAAIPIGFLIASLTRDELLDGKKWFIALIVISAIGEGVFYFLDRVYISLTFAFIFIVSLASFIKSRDKRWTKKKI